jgi:hypothetical protein
MSSTGAFATASGLSTQVLVQGADPVNDEFVVATLAGDDQIQTGREALGALVYNADGGEGADVVRYDGTAENDGIAVVANGAEVAVDSPPAARFDALAVESLIVQGLGGEDILSAVGNVAALTTLTLDGGDGSDIVRGGNGADLLLGGDGQDILDGNQGLDRALGGAGDDLFQWDPGDGSDTLEGQAGADTLVFSASNAGEILDVSANGRRVRLTRNIANVTLDVDDVEAASLRLLGGADAVVVHDLSRTDLRDVEVDLNAFGGGGDGQIDTVTVNGTERRDVVDVGFSAARVLVAGLATETRIAGSEQANDRLLVNTLGGNDDVTVAPAVNDVITPVVDLGPGD